MLSKNQKFWNLNIFLIYLNMEFILNVNTGTVCYFKNLQRCIILNLNHFIYNSVYIDTTCFQNVNVMRYSWLNVSAFFYKMQSSFFTKSGTLCFAEKIVWYDHAKVD